MSVKTPTANGLSSIPSTNRKAKTVLTFSTAPKQNVTMVQSSSAVGRYSEGLTKMVLVLDSMRTFQGAKYNQPFVRMNCEGIWPTRYPQVKTV